MKRELIFLLSVVLCALLRAQTTEIDGVVFDENKQPMSFVNVFIEGTMDGTSTNEAGKFVIKTEEKGSVTLKVSFVGYETYAITKEVNELHALHINLKPAVESLKDVVVIAGNYSLKSSTLESQNVLDLVNTAGSNGDIYNSLSMIPGTQSPGVDGRLLVRGGTSRESQTFIDGMHVLSPYTGYSSNVSARSKYSMFHFEGINFSTGGYGSEYSQSLSSILPLNTRDKNETSKYGFGLMNVNAEFNGCKAWDNGSASLSATFTDLTFYQAVFHPGENDLWDIPFRNFSVRNQLRFNINKNTILKTYYGYDKTRFRQWWEEPLGDNRRNMDYDEDNVYLNTTFRTKTTNNIHFFAGVAYSWNDMKINSSVLPGDRYDKRDEEIHLKTKASKRLSNLYKIEAGMESYLQSYNMSYAAQYDVNYKCNHNITGAFLSNDFSLSNRFFVNLSGRVEYSSLTDTYSFLPRMALSYQMEGLTFSAIVGKYQQAADPNYLLVNEKLAMETNWMTQFSAYYNKNKRIYRAEIYNKKYDDLPLLVNGTYISGGNGYSRGVDLYFDDRNLLKNFDYIVSYSYNDSKRKFLDYPQQATPDFLTRHNASLALKYSWWKMRSIIGMTNHLADGRSYHDPNKAGFMNAQTPLYHTLDLSLVVLPHPNVILYFALNNVFNRKNVYGYSFKSTPDADGHFASAPNTASQNRSFYVGIFVSFGKSKAYDPSNF